MTAVWPLDLPQRVLRQGFSEQAPDTALRTAMDSGPAKLRRKATAGVRALRCTVRVSLAQRAVLDAFYCDALEGGTAAFEWVHPLTGAPCRLRFVKPPAVVPSRGLGFDAALELEILP